MSRHLYCLNTSTIGPLPLPEKIRIAAEAGYDAIEPWNDEVTEFLATGGRPDDLRRMIDERGLRVVSMIALGGWADAAEADLPTVRDDCLRRIEQAAALGCPTIVASPPGGMVDLERAAERFAMLAEWGASLGVRPSMEFLGFVAGVRSLSAAWAIALGSGVAEPTIVPDVYHLLRGGGTLDDLLQLDGSRYAIVHWNDLPARPPPTEQTDADRVMPGEGVVDLGRVVRNLHAVGYGGPISLELFNPDLWQQDPLAVARRGLDRMRAAFE